ncbi:hypothetical protein RZS08_15945, partial [Arthrospira platensis SPKY1]|nr:hypothetical protein [Arthrospira platensis SPKY1]
KEAAHQLGTPISSLIGWLEILRLHVERPEAKEVLPELDHDIARLQMVADRFNKIGSKPDLKALELDPILQSVTDYMRKRLPSLGAELKLEVLGQTGLQIKANAQLLEWALENITKNAIDALGGVEGAYVRLHITQNLHTVHIDIEDNG